MSSIDERVVQMRFENGAFLNGVRTTMDALKNLQNGLKLNGATKGLDEVNKAAGRFSLQGIQNGIQTVQNQFSALSVIGVTALANIANQAVNAGKTLAASLTTKPIMDGLREYETNLNSVQTILANTGLKGQEGLNKVNAKLAELNTYSDQTIYNFAEMAKNIGTFTAAGVDIDTSTNAIKGIANLAAVSGSNSQQASTAMYQLSQALAAGKVSLMDWNSVVNAGMGGKVFQEALKETARVQGIAVDDIIEKNGSFRDSLQDGWITGEVLTATLAKFTGDLTEQQLQAMGYNQEQIAGIIEMGKTAQDAATKIKTVSQLINTLQEAATSGWAQTWQNVFGDFEEAKTLFTNVNNVLGGMINASSDARNKVISDWKQLGGRGVLIEGLSNAFNFLLDVMKPVREAFRQIFPPATGQQLFNITTAIRDFTAGLKIGGTTANNIKRTFAGLFAILGIGWEVIKAAGSALLSLFGVVGSGGGSFLEVTASIGDFIVGVLNAIKQGDGLKKFFQTIATVIAAPLKLIQLFAKGLASLFDGMSLGGLGSSIGNLVNDATPLASLGKIVSDVWNGVLKTISNIGKGLAPIAGKIQEFFRGLGEQFENTFGEFDYQTFLNTINTGLFAGLLLLLKNFSAKLFSIDIGGNFFSSLTDGFDSLTDTLGGMQSTLKAATLFGIAAAIALLAGSLVMLSHIDADGLMRGSAAIGVLFAQLIGATAAFAAIGTFKQFVKLPLVATGLILMAVALRILASAVIPLSELDWEELGKGLTGVITLLASMAGVVKLMAGQAAGMVTAGAGLILVATAIRILVGAVQQFSELSWEEIGKGLTGVVALLGALGLFNRFGAAGAAGLANSAGIVLLAAAIKILASAAQDFAGMSWEGIAKGLVGMAGGLAIVAGALRLLPAGSVLSAAAIFVAAASLRMIGDAIASMGGLDWGTIARGLVSMAGALALIAAALLLLPPSSLLSAAAIFIVASSLGMISDALGQMGGMSWGEIAKGLVTLAGSLAIIAGGLYLMTAALPGAAALAVVAASLALLGPVLVSFGDMSWEGIAKGLVTLAGAFTVIGLAGLVLTPVIPSLILLGVAITLLGVGALAAGAGVLMFSAGLAALAVSGAAGAAALVAIIMAVVNALPLIVAGLGDTLVAIGKAIAEAAPALVDAIVVVLESLMDAIIRLTPKIGELFGALIDLIVNVVVDNTPKVVKLFDTLVNLAIQVVMNAVPKMLNAGINIIMALLNGINQNIPRIVTAATDIIVNFINAIGSNLPRIIDAGVKLIISFINGVANAIRQNQSAMEAAGRNLADAIVNGMVKGIGNGIKSVVSAAKGMAQSALSAAKSALGIASPSKRFREIGEFTTQGFVEGLTKDSDKIDDAVIKMTDKLQSAFDSSTSEIEKAEESLKRLTEARDEDNRKIDEQVDKQYAAREKDNRAIADSEGRLKKLNQAKKKDLEAIRKAERDLLDARERRNEGNEIKKLREMEEARDKENIKIKEATDALNELRVERDKYSAAQKTVVEDLVDEQEKLKGLADRLDDVKDQLKDANKALEDSIKTRDDYRKSIGEQYGKLPDVKEDTELADFTTDIKKQIEDVKKFTSSIQEARSFGLSDQLYKELLSKGPSALPFVQQIVASGKTGVEELNRLGAELADVSDSLGFQAGRGLYQAGVDSAQSLVDGLTAQQTQIENAMQRLADQMVGAIQVSLGTKSADAGIYGAGAIARGVRQGKGEVDAAGNEVGGAVTDGMIKGIQGGSGGVVAAAITVAQQALIGTRRTLGVNSPSKEFAEIGKWSSIGLANGLQAYSGRVSEASASVGKDAIQSMSKSIQGMAVLLDSEMDVNPVISPVLDLTSVKKDASLVGAMLTPQPIAVSDAYSAARNASAGYQRNVAMGEAATYEAQPAASITLNQNNYSPKALSAAEIYRQTKNQISTLKGALPTG